MMPRNRKPKHVHHYIDRHGKERCYFKRAGYPSAPLRLPIYSPVFWEDYHRAAEGKAFAKPEIGADRTKPGTLSDLLVRYYKSPDWTGLSPTSQAVYRRQLEAFREGRGDRLVRDIQRVHMKAVIGKMADRPNAANNLLKRLKLLMAFAVDIGMIKVDPVAGMKGFKIKIGGYHTWTDAEVTKFEEKHPVGSRARLALALMLYTGQRRSDAIRMGWQHVHDGLISVRQQKTGAELLIPIHPELQRILDVTPKDDLTFLRTGRGAPFTANGFGNWMREMCDEAGLPDCSSHGLRKAMAKRLAEAGATNQQIKAITGHVTDKEVARYTKAAEQRLMAADAMKLIAPAAKAETGTEVANPNPEVSEQAA